ncbi:MAG: hypothetical protein JXR37_14945 [Kiritimatiellae bacterium]|nr:hypothetical protein [Kiritimatiellia bacterium]
MKGTLIRIIIVLCLRLAIVALNAEPAPTLPRLKDMHLETRLVENGRPASIIVVPNTPEYTALARELQAALRQIGGVTIPIRDDTAVTDADLRRFHVIVPGNLMSNKLCARLYGTYLVQIDAGRPGKGGHLLQTVHNPFAFGRNAICLGGSDFDGVRESARLFSVLAQGTRDLAFEQIFELKTASRPPDAMTPARIESIVKSLRGAGFIRIGTATTRYGQVLYDTGAPGYARLFRRLIELFRAELDKSKGELDLKWSKLLPLIWDGIEEYREFTAEDRVYISRFFYAYAHRAPYARRERLIDPKTPFGNDWNAEGSYLAGFYFWKYYPELEIGQRLMERMDRYYAHNLKHWKVAEDTLGYGDITLGGNLRYALTRPRLEFFASGRVRKAADYAVLATTNLGSPSGHGDALGGLGLKEPFVPNVLAMAAWYYGDGSYLWWQDKIGGTPGRFYTDAERTPPARLLGVAVAPLDDWIYRRGAGRRVPHAQCFDKMSFRTSFESSDQYLLLSGFCYGFHSHPDGNAIINFTDNGEIWLYDHGYMIPEMSAQNTVIVYRNGLAGKIPELVRLDHRTHFDSIALTTTTVPGYDGVDWSRSIVWAKERYFVVLDRLKAVTDGEFGFQCNWRVLHTPELAGNTLAARKDEHEFRLVNLDGSALSLTGTEPSHGSGRRLVQSVTRKLEKGDAVSFANLFYVRGPGESSRVTASALSPSLVAVHDAGHALIAGLGPTGAEAPVRTDANAFAAGARTLTAANLTRWESDAVRFAADQPVCVDLDLAAGRGLIEAAAAGKATVDGRAVSFGAGRTRVRFQPVPADRIAARAQHWSQLAQAGGPAASADTTRATRDTKDLRPAWTFDGFQMPVQWPPLKTERVTADVVPLDSNETGFTVGAVADLAESGARVIFATGRPVTLTLDLGERKEIHEVQIDSNQLVGYQGGCGVGAIVAELSDDGFRRDVRSFAALNEKTVPPQNKKIPYTLKGNPDAARSVRVKLTPLSRQHKIYLSAARVLGVTPGTPPPRAKAFVHGLEAADLDGDGNAEVVVAANDDCLTALTTRGERLWQTPMGARAGHLAAADTNGDGRDEIIAACRDKKLYCLAPNGSVLWNVEPPPRLFSRYLREGRAETQGSPSTLFARDLDGDRRPEIVLGTDTGWVFCYSADGKLLWDKESWAKTVACAIAYDLDGDGVQEAIIGNKSSSTYVHNGKTGKAVKRIGMTWHAGATALAAGEVDGDGLSDLVLGDRAGRVTFVMSMDKATKADYINRYGRVEVNSIETGARINRILIEDLDGDRRAEIVVASGNGYVYAFDGAGRTLWFRDLGGVPEDILARDLNGDGKSEILVGTENARLEILAHDGRPLGGMPTRGAVRHVRLANGRADPAIVVGCDGGYVQAFQTRSR